MSYKTILVHVDLGDGSPARIRCAAQLARQEGAHLIGAAPTGISRFIPPQVLVAARNPLARRCKTLREEALRALDRYADIVRREGPPSWEARLLDDDADGGLPIASRYSNLTLLAQPDRTVVDPLIPPDLARRVLLEGGHPVLVVPGTRPAYPLDGEVLLAWDGSPGATRAATGALPILRRARRVTVLGIGDRVPPTCEPREPCAALAAWLTRHGVVARTSRRARSDDPGMRILSEAVDTDAELIVMGAHGHPHLREPLAEGITGTILRWTHVPVLLCA